MKKRIFLLSLISGLLVMGLFASTSRYVSTTGSNTIPYTSLLTAANSISAAIGESSAGDIILVNDGTYTLSSTIEINIGITIKSINGSLVTIVDGNNAFKCFKISHTNAILDGFTIQNANNTFDQYGGGVNITTGGTVRNCTIKNNQAIDGGGVAIDTDGLVENCYITDNLASNNGSSGYGGGVRLLNGGEVRNCVITRNTSVKYGGGVNIWNGGKVKNCVITKNTAPAGKGGGIRTRGNSKIYNCIIWLNNGENWAVDGTSYHYYNCNTTPSLPGSYSTDCISSDPLFTNINPGFEDYRLTSSSPSIDAGMNFAWMNTTPDLDGNARIVNSICDMGPYEYYAPPVDTDGDGIPDISEDYPNDALRAFDNLFPRQDMLL